MQEPKFAYASFGPGNNVELVKFVVLTRPWWAEAKSDQKHNLRWQMCAPSTRTFNEAEPGVQLFSHLPNYKALHSKWQYYNIFIRHMENPFSIVKPTYLFQGADKAAFKRHFDYLAGQFQPSEEFPLTREEQSTTVQENQKNLWILKPLALNRGRGILVVSSVQQAESHVTECENTVIREVTSIKDISNAGGHSQWLIQKYIENPMLINGRKFDIRVYALAMDNGDCYIYKTGYLRTSGTNFSLDDTNLAIHLTNNAVQQYLDDYQAYEEGNMISFDEFSEIIKEKCSFYDVIWPKIQQIMTDVMQAASLKLIQQAQCKNCFELFGFDFMIDENYNPWAIEVNSNPCLELSSAVSWSILPYLLDDLFDLTIDRVFSPPSAVLDIWKQRRQKNREVKQQTLEEIKQIKQEDRKVNGLKWQCLYSDEVCKRNNGFIQVVKHFRKCKDFVQ